MVASVYLWIAQRDHFPALLPFAILAACPLMHVFMHRGHGGHAHGAKPKNNGMPRGCSRGARPLQSRRSGPDTKKAGTEVPAFQGCQASWLPRRLLAAGHRDLVAAVATIAAGLRSENCSGGQRKGEDCK